MLLSPFPKQCHHTCSDENVDHHENQPLALPRQLGVEQEIAGKEFDQSSVDEDPGRDGVEDTGDDICSEGAAVIGGAETEPDGD